LESIYPFLATLAAYLIGSLSFAVIVSKAMGLKDPRTFGSKNPGATNVLRSGSKPADARRLNTLGVGGYLGEISLLLDGPTSARVTARTNVKALFISREAFRQYVANTPTAALRIYRLFSTNLAERVRTLSTLR